MLWESLLSPDIKEAVDKKLIAVLPIGSVEIHGPHMPTGTDSLTIREIVIKAAEKEPAIVLPTLYYAYVPENKHFPGTISLSARTILAMIEEICEEVSRNGFKKILIVNGHGGNSDLLRVFLKESLHKKRDYVIYALIEPWLSLREVAEKICESKTIGHACELETSMGLFLFENLIKMENVKREARAGSTNLDGIETPVNWQAYAIDLYTGDPRLATKEKGKILIEKLVDFVAEAIRRIKQDEKVPRILDDFYKRAYGQ
ncbi:MAG: creatininase family protein [Candidatus Brockarchaeota archaeon]|nr:creatininase family protein [Candidatus Brockarchaeota archaeon]